MIPIQQVQQRQSALLYFSMKKKFLSVISNAIFSIASLCSMHHHRHHHHSH